MGGTQMNRKMKRIFAVLMIALLVAGIATTVAGADMGPKPSITLKVVNAPEDYYVALLTLREKHPDLENSTLKLDVVDDEHVEKYLDEFWFDCWSWFDAPGVSYKYFHSTKEYKYFTSVEEGSYYFNYSVPDHFRVILIAADGTVHLSGDLKRVEYNAYCTYDYETGELTEQWEQRSATRISVVIVYFIVTLIIEFGVMMLLQYPCTGKNVLRFILINAFTNIPFNIILAHRDADDWGGMFFICEPIIIILEAILYARALYNREGKKSWGKGILFSIAGNIFSAVCIFIPFVDTFLHFVTERLADLITKIW